MYNYKLIRLEYVPIFYFMFVSGICAGSIIGLIFALLDRSFFGLFIAAFITLLFGLGSGLLGLIYTVVFNMLAPNIGGISMGIILHPDAAKSPNDLTSLDSPIDL